MLVPAANLQFVTMLMLRHHLLVVVTVHVLPLKPVLAVPVILDQHVRSQAVLEHCLLLLLFAIKEVLV